MISARYMHARMPDVFDSHHEQYKAISDPSSCFEEELQQFDLSNEPVTIHGPKHHKLPSITSSQYADSVTDQFKTGRFAEDHCSNYEFLRHDEYAS